MQVEVCTMGHGKYGDTVVRHYSGKLPDGTREMLVCHGSQYDKFVS